MEEELWKMTPAGRLRELARQGRIVQGIRWRTTLDSGIEAYSLYNALDPAGNTPRDCPPSVMPRWLAAFIPYVNDWASQPMREEFIDWLIDALPCLPGMTEETEKLVQASIMTACLDLAEPHCQDNLCGQVKKMWRRVIKGDPPTELEWEDAALKARVQIRGLDQDNAPMAAKYATWSAYRAARAALDRNHEDPADAAWCASGAAAAAARANGKPAAAATSAAWDKITGAIMDAVEEECY